MADSLVGSSASAEARGAPLPLRAFAAGVHKGGPITPTSAGDLSSDADTGPEPPADSGSEPISIVIVDDHMLLADSLATTLDANDDMKVVAVAGTCADGLSAVTRFQPDVLLLDQWLPDGRGTDIVAALLAASPRTKVLLVTAATGDDVLARAVLAGAGAVIPKGRPAAAVMTAVRAAAKDEALITPDALRRMLPRLLNRTRSLGCDITDRELQVLRLLALGMSTAAISASLFVASATTRNHIQSIMTKLGAHSRLEAVAIAGRENLLSD